MNKIERLWFRIANYLEKTAYRMKDHGTIRAQERFYDKYQLTDGEENPHRVTKYNYYQGVSVLLLDRLIESGWVKKEDHILDVGCGAGMFVFYMASQGYKHLYGQEMDRKLYNLALKNKENFPVKNSQITFTCGNAIELGIPDQVNVAYLFNPFYDQATYEEWLAKVKESLDNNPRTFRLILLYPTPASLSAIYKNSWLHEKDKIVADTYVCGMCVHFRIYDAFRDGASVM